VVEVEAVAVDIVHSELTQSPRLAFERFNDACSPRAKFVVGGVEVRSKDPVDGRFERTFSLRKKIAT